MASGWAAGASSRQHRSLDVPKLISHVGLLKTGDQLQEESVKDSLLLRSSVVQDANSCAENRIVSELAPSAHRDIRDQSKDPTNKTNLRQYVVFQLDKAFTIMMV